jgi:hypothetical protein
MIVSALIAILRPDMLVRESRRNWETRLRELDAGAPEAYFEERRELEAFRPRFDLSHTMLRRFALVCLILGIAALAMGLT